MSTEKKWICPKCSEEFGTDYLRCPCGYEGSPIYSNRRGIYNKYDKLKIKNINSYDHSSESKDVSFSEKNIISKSEIDFNKLKKEIDKNEILNRKLKYIIYKLNKIVDRDSYRSLGVHKTDTIETIHKTYKAILNIYHPDKHSAATEESIKQKNNYIAEINEAYKKILQMKKESIIKRKK